MTKNTIFPVLPCRDHLQAQAPYSLSSKLILHYGWNKFFESEKETRENQETVHFYSPLPSSVYGAEIARKEVGQES